MTDQPADNYIKQKLKPNQKTCTCCQLPFKYTKKWNPEVLMREAIKIYGDTVKFEKNVEICRKCWDGLERPKEEDR